MSDLMYLYSV